MLEQLTNSSFLILYLLTAIPTDPYYVLVQHCQDLMVRLLSFATYAFTRDLDQQNQHPDMDPRPGPGEAWEGCLGRLRPAPDQAHLRPLQDQEVPWSCSKIASEL